MRQFTLPGEAGYEALTLTLAKRWGADVIRDSDGTKLSDEILHAGYQIYSTICPIREHNPWIRENMHARQMTFLSTQPRIAETNTLSITLMADFFSEQFSVCDDINAMKYWQVYDRTSNTLLPSSQWRYENGVVTIDATPFVQYTVSFLAWRNWEEISMYNHTTNNWTKEKLMQLNPYATGAMDYLKNWFIHWCETHADSDVVRFTALHYNFAWIWGSNERNRHLFTDWASYDFTVCTEALDDFEKEMGYALTAEDFVRQGKYNATHRVPDQKKLDWMAFIGKFVRSSTRELVDIVQSYGKKAYVFYDDSWVGMEPYSGHFNEMNFDGLIKCVFSGYEVRLCADVPVKTHEIRFHPYLFPVGLGGLPTFSPGGEPEKDAMHYWINVRRALLRAKIERSGLGGYLSLTQDYPKFLDAMDLILDQFEAISKLHDVSKPETLKTKIAVLHAWGDLRRWTLSGHFHETDQHVLIHVIEALSGLPFDVKFICFDSVKDGALDGIDVVINAGNAGDAWSGGKHWNDAELVQKLTQWVYDGGTFVGIGEPSATDGFATYLRMAHVLGVDVDNGEYACHGKWQFDVASQKDYTHFTKNWTIRNNVRLTDGNAKVIAVNENNIPNITVNHFGKGKGIYLADFKFDHSVTHGFGSILLQASTGSVDGLTDNAWVECAVFGDKVAFINNANKPQKARVYIKNEKYDLTIATTLDAYEYLEMDLS